MLSTTEKITRLSLMGKPIKIKYTVPELQELFIYRDGELFWRYGKKNGIKAGAKAGGVNNKGYGRVRIKGIYYATHRIIFFMHNGWCPPILDHINLNKLDNRIKNLRPATDGQNSYNQKIKKTNTSGYKGVHWRESEKKWRVAIKKDKKNIYLGSFSDVKEAAEAYRKAAIELHGEFAAY